MKSQQPSPKFCVGQIVCGTKGDWVDHPMRILSRSYLRGTYRYIMESCGDDRLGFRENHLRALCAHEKG